MRTGLLAKKVGMSRILTAAGLNIPVTLLKVDECIVVGNKTEEKDGYNAVQIGLGKRKVKNVSKPLRGHYAKSKVEPCERLVEFRVAANALIEPGKKLSAYHFIAGQKVDVTGTSICKGFAGGMKRHNFGGLEASHGVSISHRSHGSTGHCQEPGKVFKGKKMAGQMGNVRTTIQNLEVLSSDEDEGIIAVKGSIPGAKGSFVMIKDAVKKAAPEGAPFPAAIFGEKAAKEAAEAAEKAAAEEAAAAEAERQAKIAEEGAKAAEKAAEASEAESDGDNESTKPAAEAPASEDKGDSDES